MRKHTSLVSLTGSGDWRYAGPHSLDELEEGAEMEGVFSAPYYTGEHKEGGRVTIISGVKEASFLKQSFPR